MGLTLTVTNAGRAALVNASNTGTAPVTIAQVGLTGTAVTPDPGATALPGEFKRIATLSGDVVADDTIHLIVRDETGDVFTVRSLALYLGDGTLFAMYGQADVLVEKSAQALMLLAIDVQFADVDATDLTFGDANFLNPPATTEQMGVVELSTLAEAIGGSSSSRVPAEKMVKDAVNAWLDARFGANNAGIWHPGNDGAGSGLDADLLDGQQGSWYSNIPARLGYNPIQQGTGNGQLAGNVIKIGWSAASRIKATVDVTDQGNLVTDPYLAGGGLGINGAYMNRAGIALWGPDNDGSGSGLDADTVDGFHANAFARMTQQNTFTSAQVIDVAGSQLIIHYAGANSPSTILRADGSNFYFLLSDPSASASGAYNSARPFNITLATGLVTMNNGLEVKSSLTFNGNTVWRADNDGSGSGLDADLLDGLHGSAFARTDIGVRQAFNGNLLVGAGQAAGNEGGQIDFARAPSGAMTGDPSIDVYGDGFRMLGYFSSGVRTLDFSFAASGGAVWHSGNDGSGSGLDADSVDGYQATALARLAVANKFSAMNTFSTLQQFSGGGLNGGIALVNPNGGRNYRVLQKDNGSFAITDETAGSERISINSSGLVSINAGTAWHSGNDGSGSGLDADLLDGAHASWFADIPARLGYTPVQQGGGAGQGTNKVYMGWGGSRLKVQVDSTDQGNVVFDTHVSDVWRSSNDGSGSGLDADLLDGYHASAFAKLAQLIGAGSQSSGYFDIPVSGLGTLRLVWGRNTVGGNTGTLITMGYSFSAGFVGGVIGIPDSDISHTDNINGWLYDDTRMYLVNGQNSAVSLQWFALGLA